MSDVDSFDHVVRSAQRGDGQAFAILYESLNRRVRAFAAARGAADPEGLVNEVFLKVFTSIGAFVGDESHFASWVFTIARHRLIDEARRRGRRVEESTLTDDEHPPALGDVERDAFDRLGNDWVDAQLSILTQEQRDVVLLRVVSALTIDEIAIVLKKRVGAVKALQRRALRSLARNLDRQAVPR